MENIPKETIIYGGAFNPPTRAHQAILQACVDYAQSRQAEVWLLPSANRRDKKAELSRDYRLELCEALTQDVMRRTVQLSVNTMELDRAVITATYDTVRELELAYPDRAFTWVFGADSVATMPTWHRGAWLLRNMSMLVIERAGFTDVELAPNATLLQVETDGISSTEVRRRLSQGQSFHELVSPRVAALLG